jgi:methyl-accepting chemotaxis protein
MSASGSHAERWRMSFAWPWSRPKPAPLAEVRRVDEALVMAEIAQGRERVAGRVEELKALSERETLACGSVLSSIVDNVRELITETDRTVAAAKARSDAATARFIEGMQQDAAAQQAAVTQVLGLADGVEEAIRSINGLTQYSNLLAINARIEAARLGEQGRGFAVIAQHMRDLAQTIRESADKVSAAIGAVRQGLPPVGARASSMHERTRGFVEEVGAQARPGSAAAEAGSAQGSAHSRLDAVIELSNQALSHLQFQDPLVQDLSSIDRDVALVENRVRRVLQGENLEAVSTDQSSGGQPAPGKITLF